MAQGTAVESSVPVQYGDPVDLPAEEIVTDPAGDEPAPDPAIEARAREMGWKPLAEYRGPPGKWQPAADFIARGENILPIVRENNRRLAERVGKLEGEISGLRATAGEQLQIIKDLRSMGQRADQRGYDRAMAEIKAKQRQAVEVGDTKAYDQLVEQAEALAGSRPTATAEPPARPTEPQRPAAPPVSEATKAFVAANSWFNRDRVLNAAMIAHHIEVINEGQILDEASQYEEAKQRVMERYPEKFDAAPPARDPPPRPPTPPRRRASAVTPPTPDIPPPRQNGAALSIASIADPAERAEAKLAFERLKRQLPDTTEAQYMAIYADPHGDILDLQAKARTQPNGR